MNIFKCYKIILTLFCSVYSLKGNSQSIEFFDIIPELDGKYLQAQALIVLPDTNEIFVMGHMIDTTLQTGMEVIRPYLASFDYNGNLINYFIIYDSIQNRFHIFTRPIIKDSASIIVYIDKRNKHDALSPMLLEIDTDNGSILRSQIYSQPPGSSNHRGEWYYRDSKKNIIAYHWLDDQGTTYIRKIDSSFNETSSFFVDENERQNGPRYIEALNDSTFILIGMSIAPSSDFFSEAKPYYMKVDKTGKILDFKLAPDISHKVVGFSALNSYTVLKDEHGNWVITVVFVNNPDCPTCYGSVPFSFSTSADFDSLIWINYFSELPFTAEQNYSITSSTLSNDQSSFVVAGYDFSLENRNSFLVKMSIKGEKLWIRNFIHANWAQERISWANVEDVKSTPFNTFVLAGVIFDEHSWTRVPWLLHLDSMGCLIPGCHEVVSTNELQAAKAKDFVVYPNPVTDNMYILYKGYTHFTTPVTILLYSITGDLIKEAQLEPNTGDQYIFSLNNIPAGNYTVRFQNKFHSYLQLEHLIKL